MVVTNSCVFSSAADRIGNPLACCPGQQLPALKPDAVGPSPPTEAGPGQLLKRREQEATGAARTASRRPGPHSDSTALSRNAAKSWSGERLPRPQSRRVQVGQGRGGKSADNGAAPPASVRLAHGPCGRGRPRTTRNHSTARRSSAFVLKACFCLPTVECWCCRTSS